MSTPEFPVTELYNNSKLLLNFQRNEVQKVLPEWFREDNSKFISLLKAYYEWFETQDIVKYNDLRNINNVPSQYLTFLEDEFLAGEGYFNGVDDLRSGVKFSSYFFKSKGTEQSIKLFFKSFYGEEASVTYPKDNLLVLEKSLPVTNPLPLYNVTTLTELAIDLLKYVVSVPSIFGADVWSQTAPNGFLYGDVTNDGMVGAADALEIAKYAIGSITNVTAIDHIRDYVLTNSIIKQYYTNYVSSTGTKLGEGRVLNNGQYQQNSINIETSLSPDVWLDTYKLLIHPAGMYLSINGIGYNENETPTSTIDDAIYIDFVTEGPSIEFRSRLTTSSTPAITLVIYG